VVESQKLNFDIAFVPFGGTVSNFSKKSAELARFALPTRLYVFWLASA